MGMVRIVLACRLFFSLNNLKFKYRNTNYRIVPANVLCTLVEGNNSLFPRIRDRRTCSCQHISTRVTVFDLTVYARTQDSMYSYASGVHAVTMAS